MQSRRDLVRFMVEQWQDRVRRLMRERELTQDDIAGALGLSGQSAVTNYLTGRRELKARQALRLAELFGISVDELLVGARVDRASRRARAAVAELLGEALAAAGRTLADIGKRFAGLDPAYLPALLAAERDLTWGDVRTLGPIFGPEVASQIVDILSERDGPPIRIA